MPFKTFVCAVSVLPLLNDKDLLSLAETKISEKRLEKARRYKKREDECLCVAAELLLVKMLRSVGFECPLPDTVNRINEKPYLNGTDIYFNISHSGEYAVCALSQYEIGCDIERCKPANKKTARRFFCKSEYDEIFKTDDEESINDTFFRIWTLKESFMKATGLGLKLPLDSFCVSVGDTVSVRQSVDKRKYCFYEFSGIAGYKCSLCMADGNEKPDFKILNISEII